jgi:hypothetical protein
VLDLLPRGLSRHDIGRSIREHTVSEASPRCSSAIAARAGFCARSGTGSTTKERRCGVGAASRRILWMRSAILWKDLGLPRRKPVDKSRKWPWRRMNFLPCAARYRVSSFKTARASQPPA